MSCGQASPGDITDRPVTTPDAEPRRNRQIPQPPTDPNEFAQMDAAPLTAAHSHARTAAQETQKAKPDYKVAKEEHELAAGEFATARGGTEDSEVHVPRREIL